MERRPLKEGVWGHKHTWTRVWAQSRARLIVIGAFMTQQRTPMIIQARECVE